MEYTVIKSEDFLWTVGFYNPSGKWVPESDHDSKSNALDRANFLNGDTADFCYIKSEPGLYTVGTYGDHKKWHPYSDHNDKEEAAKVVNELNTN